MFLNLSVYQVCVHCPAVYCSTMSQENARDNAGESLESQNNNNGQSRGDSSTSSAIHQPDGENQLDQATELQRLRTEALERILMGSESNLSLANPTGSQPQKYLEQIKHKSIFIMKIHAHALACATTQHVSNVFPVFMVNEHLDIVRSF